jgi:hypothetical protein
MDGGGKGHEFLKQLVVVHKITSEDTIAKRLSKNNYHLTTKMLRATLWLSNDN